MEMQLNNKLTERIEDNIREYLRDQGKNTKMTVHEYFTKFKPLSRIKLMCFGIPMIIGLLYRGPIIMIFGAMVGLFPYVLVTGIKGTKENLKQHKYQKQENVGEKVFDFIRSNNKYNEIEVDEFDKNYVRIIFKKQTYHKIKFNEEKGIYQILADRCTLKHALKHASARPSNILFRNAKHVNPILKAMVDSVVGPDIESK